MKRRIILLGLVIFLAISTRQMSAVDTVSAGSGCLRDVPVFTTDTAPTDGELMFDFGGEGYRTDSAILRSWEVAAGQQVNNDIVSNVPAPGWARLWWQPFGDSTWYLLPSQYWRGDGMTTSFYGVSCEPAAQPSYHTAFGSAIPEDQLPSRACLTTPALVHPSHGAKLNTLIPVFEWDYGHAPGAIGISFEIAKDSSFSDTVWGFGDPFFYSKDVRIVENLEASTTYYWRVLFECTGTEEPLYEVRQFTTGFDGVTLPPPTLIAPTNTSTISLETASLRWEAVEGAVEYLVKWGESKQTTGITRPTTIWVWASGTQYETSSKLRPNITYEWAVAARNEYAIGEFATWQFTTSSSLSSSIPSTASSLLPPCTPFGPDDDSNWYGAVQLEWAWERELFEDEYFAVYIWPEETWLQLEEAERYSYPSKTWTKNTSWLTDLPDESEGWFICSVVVIREVGPSVGWQMVSQPSQTRRFYFRPISQ